MTYTIISFYRYINLDNPEALRDELRAYCQEHDILGRILIGKEGINGAVSGTNNNIAQFKQKLQDLFADLTFREQPLQNHSYHKLVVRLRKEICAFGTDVNVENTGVHLPAKELQKWYENNEDFVIIDARNDYEFDVGKFKDAIKLPIKTFREFPEAIKKVEQIKNKQTKVVLYCTGGIRCEKASAYMKEQGYDNVYQLDGGIINYANLVGDEKWEGGLFVFDDRLVSDIGQAITECIHCGKDSEQYINCHNLDCDKLVIVCEDCQEKMNKTCSQECMDAPRQRKEKQPPKQVLGIVENYYAKNHVVQVKLKEPLTLNATIEIVGKTTKDVTAQIVDLRDEHGTQIESANTGDVVTFVVDHKVRKNDKVVVA